MMADDPVSEGGRPSDYSFELASLICEQLGNGTSLRSIGCDPEMPDQSTIYRWLAKHEEFREMYVRARETQAETLADEMLDIADNAINDWMERSEEKGGGYELNGEHVRRTQLRIDTRKWLAAKLLPKKYGEATLLKHADADGNKFDLAAEIAARRARVAEERDGNEG